MLPTIAIDGTNLSDLFFNADNVNYAAACKNPTVDFALHKALLEDAQIFAELLGYPELAEQLQEDFLNRL